MEEEATVLPSTEGKTSSPGDRPEKINKEGQVRPLLVAALLRVSTEEQALWMEAQRLAITTWAERTGARIGATFLLALS